MLPQTPRFCYFQLHFSSATCLLAVGRPNAKGPLFVIVGQVCPGSLSSRKTQDTQLHPTLNKEIPSPKSH